MMVMIHQDKEETTGTITREEILPEDHVVETLMMVGMEEMVMVVVVMTRVEEVQLVETALEESALVMSIQ